ncbi:MAG: YigZ family protein [Christensenellaceae bacterium]|jgi:IMPACT family member yigZ|nr:YigZ family protein [Christensenellaceae bacterium]PWL99928.1 MAG: hypothetical protein DBY09_03695 [Selenomonadales bacterium]
METYRTLLNDGKSEYIINKSRFIARAQHINCQEEADKALSEEKKAYPDATHHCSAYILDPKGNVARFNDDGEPQGTAGKPILEVMRRQELAQAIVIVTRYFGGILLGAAGLIRAYAHSAALAVEQAGICQMYKSVFFELKTDYKELDRLKYLLSLPENSFIRQLETIYAERPVLKMLIKKADAENAREKLNKYLSGRLILNISEAGYMPWQTDIK